MLSPSFLCNYYYNILDLILSSTLISINQMYLVWVRIDNISNSSIKIARARKFSIST